MQEFLTVVLGYPTLPYSILLLVSVMYWAVAAFGLVDDGFGNLGADGAIEAGPTSVACRPCWRAGAWVASRSWWWSPC